MKAVVLKKGEKWFAEEQITHVHYQIMQDYLPLKDGQIVWGKIVEHSNEDRIHQYYFELHEPQPKPESQLSEGGEEKKWEQGDHYYLVPIKEYEACVSVTQHLRLVEKSKKFHTAELWSQEDFEGMRNIAEELTKENRSLKQHNLKLTECLGELISKAGLPAYSSDLQKSITKAKSLIK